MRRESCILREEAIRCLSLSQETDDERESLQFMVLALRCLERFLDVEGLELESDLELKKLYFG